MPESAPPSDVSAALPAPQSAASPPPEVRIQALLGPAQSALLDELTELLLRELHAGGHTPSETGELAVRAALLLWDGSGRADAALGVLDEIPESAAHPVAAALRLNAALDGLPAGEPGAATSALLAQARLLATRGTAAARAELGELLLWRGEYETAATLLDSGDVSGRRLRALALCALGRADEAASLLAESDGAGDLLWAAHLRTERAAGDADATELAARALGAADGSDVATLPVRARAIERLLRVPSDTETHRSHIALLRQKLALLGGMEALGQPGAERRVELLATAVRLSGLLEQCGEDDDRREAGELLGAVASFCLRSDGSAAHLGAHVALAASARLYEQTGQLALAAQQLESLGARLVELTGAGRLRESELSEPERAAQAFALTYLHRAAALWDTQSEGGDETAARRAHALYTRLYGYGAPDESTVLRHVRLLLLGPGPRGERVEIARALGAGAQALPPGSAGQARLSVWAARAAEATRAPGSDMPDLGAIGVDRRALETLARHHRRRGERAQQVATYRRLASLDAVATYPEEHAELIAATYSSVAAALALGLSGPTPLATEEAPTPEELLSVQRDAERFSELPGGALVYATRVLLCQRLGRHAELGAALQGLLARARSTETQAQLYRQLGNHAAEHAGDLALAERSYAEVLKRQPSDVPALHALARLLQQRGDFERAAGLLQQAVESALQLSPADAPLPAGTGGPSLSALLGESIGRGRGRGFGGSEDASIGAQAAALLCCELGALYEHLSHSAAGKDGDGGAAALDQAVSCYTEALRRDPRCRPAARALVALYRTLQRPAELLAAMGQLLPLLRDDAQRFNLLLEIGHTAQQRAGELGGVKAPAAQPAIEQAIGAYSEALALDPGHGGALSQLIGLCRATERWALLAETLVRAPQTAPVLATLREAYERLDQTAELARVREAELQLFSSKEEVSAAARALAQLYQRLERPEDEVRAWERLYEVAPEELWHDPRVLLALEKRYGASGRHADQAALLGRAIEHLSATEAQPSEGSPPPSELREQRRTLLLRLGEVQREALGDPAQATDIFERVLAEWGQDHAALLALAGLYARPGQTPDRTEDLRRVLGTLLETATEPGERSKLLSQLGELQDRQGHQAEAFQSYGQAFYLDPTNRAAFTAFERLCYKREQWAEAIKIYDTALKLIETQKSRSYRPADLYLRRAQVMLNYLQRPDEALQNYLRAMESDAENDNTQTALENLYGKQNMWKELLAAYERRATLVREDAKRVEVLRRAAQVAAVKLRDLDESVRFYEKLHAVDPTDSEALDALERRYQQTRDFEKLVGLLSTRVALAVDENQIIALNMRIGQLCEEDLRDHDRAISAYRQVVEQQPAHREALDAMARLFEANERWAELLDVTRRQIRIVTDRAQKALLYFKCGSVTEAKFNKEDDAIRFYEAAVRTSPACLPALHSLRDIYIRREDWTRVTQTLELESKLWTEDKERAGILAHIGQIYLDKLKNGARAIEYYESALGVDKDCIPANRALFGVYFSRGDWPRAQQAGQVLFAKASREGEPSERSEFHRKRAVVAERTGNLRLSCECVIAALDVFPENIAALELLVALCQRPGREAATGIDFGPTCRELEKQFRRRNLPRCLSLVLIAQAALAEPGAEVETAESLLSEAVRLAPEEWLPAESLAALYERLRRFDAARGALSAFIARHEPALLQPDSSAYASLNLRVRAQLRLAQMYGEAMLESEQAVVVLRGLCADEARALPQNRRQVPASVWRDARFRLTQELYLLGRYSDARGEIEGLIELATQTPSTPGDGSKSPVPPLPSAATPEELATYYDYLGRILEAMGEGPAAQRAYRRAVDLDPLYAQPVLALARRAATAGDRAQAELLLRDALALIVSSGRNSSTPALGPDGQPRDLAAEELRLRRGLARLLAQFDPPQAVDVFQKVIHMTTQRLRPDALASQSSVPPLAAGLSDSASAGGGQRAAWETLEDRVALAELFLHRIGDIAGARRELHAVLQRELRYAPAYPLLTAVHERAGEAIRVERVRALSTLLGYIQTDRRVPPRPPMLRPFPHRGTLSDELRQRNLLPAALSTSPYFELVRALGESLLRLFPSPWPLPIETTPASKVADAGFKVCLADVQRLYGLEADVLVGTQVPGYALALELAALPEGSPRPVIVVEASALDRPDAERRFLLGRAIEPLRGGYALTQRLSAPELAQLGRLCALLLGPPTEYDGPTRDFAAQLAPREQGVLARLLEKQAERQAGIEGGKAVSKSGPGIGLPSAPEVLLALQLCADRAGLLCADDIAASIRMMARVQGEELAVSVVDGQSSGILLGQVTGAAELARYSLSDSYNELTSALRTP